MSHEESLLFLPKIRGGAESVVNGRPVSAGGRLRRGLRLAADRHRVTLALRIKPEQERVPDVKNEIEFRVEWGETDPAAITFYPNFFKWFDRGTWNLLAAAGLTHKVLRDEYGLVGCPIVEAMSKFHSPARFWDQVRITSFVRCWSRKTFQVVHEVRIEGRLCAEGLETRVWTRKFPGHPERMEAVFVPDVIKQKLPAAEVS